MPPQSNARIFISYSHRGNGPEWKAWLLRHLGVFERHHLLDVWDDERIRASQAWDEEIKEAISSASAAILLLTPEALESDYIRRTELPFLKGRWEREKTPIFPVICEPCRWKEEESSAWLRSIQTPAGAEPLFTPAGSKPLSDFQDATIDRHLRELATDVANELSRIALAELSALRVPPSALGEARTYLDKFPLTRGPGLREEKLIGREQELALLDLAFASSFGVPPSGGPGNRVNAELRTAIVSLVAWGGVGKSMLVQHWLQRLQRENWFDARRVYAWSFYSQGTKEDRQASEDTFLAHALEWFGVQCQPTLSPWDKGRLLADAVARERTLLILDGIEPLQYPPGPMGGQLRAPGVQSLLKQLARKANSSKSETNCLCLVTTREPLTDLADFQRRPDAAWGSVLRVDLGNLTDKAGAALLHHAGADHVGAQKTAAENAAENDELLKASREVDGHALTLNLLGRFLARAHNGDIRRRDLVKFEKTEKPYEHAFKMLAALEDWFSRGSEIYKQQLTILRLLGLFDRPAEADCLAALRKTPPIAGLTDALFDSSGGFLGFGRRHQPLSHEDWNAATRYLSEFGLIHIQPDAENRESSLDCHPLIRQHFGEKLQQQFPRSTKEAHSRVCDYLLGAAEPSPSTVKNLEPLYHAITHGCAAKRFQEMVETVYRNRINRGTHEGGFYSTRILGAYGLDLSAVAAFFTEPWKAITPQIKRADQGWATYAAGFLLRAVGRLDEALEPMRLGVRMAVEDGDWINAAKRTRNLSQALELLGRIKEAAELADLAEQYARRSKNPNEVVHCVAGAGDPPHQLGDIPRAASKFEEAETIQAKCGGFAYLGSLQGHLYCELLLRRSERLAWSEILRLPAVAEDSQAAARACESVINRAQATFIDDGQGGMGALSLAVSLLSMGRAAIYYWILVPSERTQKVGIVARMVDDAFDRIKKANAIHHVPSVLMSRAMLYCSRARYDSSILEGKESESADAMHQSLAAARAALDEAWDIAERGPMRLHLADIHLHRARLFFREKEYPWREGRNLSGEFVTNRTAADDLAAAEKLINDCGYHRRDEELADAKRAILGA